MRALRRRHTCDEPYRPGPWVRAIARREAWRIAGGRRKEPLEAAPEPVAAGDEELTLARMTVRAVVAGLSVRDRELLHATYWEDLSGADASLRLGHPEATVRVRPIVSAGARTLARTRLRSSWLTTHTLPPDVQESEIG